MKRTRPCQILASLGLLVISLVLPLHAAEKTPWQQALFGDPVKTLPNLREQFEETMKEHEDDSNHPAVALASAMVGAAASRAGNHEEALEHLESSLATLSDGVWKNVDLRIIEFQLRLALASSLQELDRAPEAFKVLESLVKRTKTGLQKEPLAAQKKLFGYEKEDGVGLKATFPQDDWLVTLNENLGKLELLRGNWAAAEKALQEAGDLLKQIDPSRIKRAEALQKAREEAARKQGKEIRPRIVGRFSNPDALEIKGAQTFTPKQIRSALARSEDFVSASHPEAEFEQFLGAVQGCLERGYRAMGFARPAITLSWDESSAKVVVTITEGPRFRAGQIQVKYGEGLASPAQRLIEVDQLKAALRPVSSPDHSAKSRMDAAFRKTNEKKQLPAARVTKALKEAFPDLDRDGNPNQFLNGVSDINPEAQLNQWESGKWIDFDPDYRRKLAITIRSVLAEKGLFSPELELTFEENPAEAGTSDLIITIRSEGHPLRLGKIIVAGNRLNTSEQLLDFLELEKGMALQGPWTENLERALYRSGRFVGWHFTPREAPDERPHEVDLLIHVEELWFAPPLSEALTPEQEALLKVIDWMTSEMGTTEDLVLNLAIKHPSGPMALGITIGREVQTFSLTGLGHEVHLVVTDGKEVEILAISEERSFHATESLTSNSLFSVLSLLNTPKANPFAMTGGVDFGLGFSTLVGKSSGLLIDPTVALEVSRFLPVIDNGVLMLKMNPLVARFDATNGKLLSLTLEGADDLLVDPVIGKMEAGATARTRQAIKEKAAKNDNWLTGRKSPSLAYQTLFFGWEFFQLFGEDDALTLSPTAFTARAAQRASQREPLAVFLGEVTSALWDDLKGNGQEALDRHEFSVPSDRNKLENSQQPGMMTTLLVRAGFFDLLSRNFEPGSWPDPLVREFMSFLDGNPTRFDETRRKLLANEQMGPIGSLVCAGLLSKLGHPGAFDFLAKAEFELNEKGFEKDWLLLLPGKEDGGGIGWKIVKALRHLKDPDLDRLLPDKEGILYELALKAVEITPATKETTLRPIMNALWEDEGHDLVKQGLLAIRTRLLSNWNPETTAAVVNGRGIPRGAVNLERNYQSLHPNRLGMNPADDCIASFLVAMEIWKAGQFPRQDAIIQQAEAIIARMGGWIKIEQLGFTRESFAYWVGVLISRNAQLGQLMKGKLVTEEEARQFFESSAALNTREYIHLHMIALKVNDNLADQQKKAAQIREQIVAATRGKIFMRRALKNAFVEEAKRHSMDRHGKDGGCLGWRMEQELPGFIAPEIAKLKNGSLSEVITLNTGEQTAVYLFLVPDARRPVPFEKVKSEAMLGAYFDKLFRQAQIHRLPKLKPLDPTDELPENQALKNLNQVIEGLLKDLDARALPPGLDHGNDRPKNAHPFAKLPLPERIIRGAATGRAEDLFLLGTYAERGISPEKNGLPEAIRLYRESAEKGETKAMLRLAELHRTGRGVERDPSKYREWLNRAGEALKN